MSTASAWKRRAITIPRTFAVFVLLTVLSPVLFAIALLVDVVRALTGSRQFATIRVVAFGWVYFAVETIGILRLTFVWLTFRRNEAVFRRRVRKVQMWFARNLLRGVTSLFGLQMTVDDPQVATPGPMVMFVRHSSIIDTLLPPALIGDQFDLRLRWVVKAELLADPALDLAGLWLDNCFVDRSAGLGEIRRIRRLGQGLTEDEGVVIYPEGSRFTEARRKRAIEKLTETSPDLAQRARSMTHVLPPRPGGALALLQAGTDVVLCGHVGLDGFAKVTDIWTGNLVGSTVQVWFHRVPAAEIPKGRDDRVTWLFDQWAALDREIAQRSD
ncbi:MAG: 1-acyl-sn-glycerol-3-phosphate acyltransferase [Acidimicrobiia bacterium]|nr:1-acyl-sn-glycerol-3-phosphate acyltransferase [Acidimicrobiia bacterium]